MQEYKIGFYFLLLQILICFVRTSIQSSLEEKQEEDIPQCVVDVIKLFFPIHGSIFVSLPTGRNSSDSQVNRRLKRYVYEQKFSCSDKFSHAKNYSSLSGESLDKFRNTCDRFFTPKLKQVPTIRNTSYSGLQNKIIQSIHSTYAWTVTVDTLTSDYRYFYEHFDGFVFILLESNFREDVLRQKAIMQNLSIRKAKVIIIIFGYLKFQNFLFITLDQFSLYETMVIRPVENGTIQILTWSYYICGNFIGGINFLGTCKEANLFPNTIKIPKPPKSYPGCALQLTNNNNPPFIVTSSHKRTVGGIEHKIIKIILSYFNFKVGNLKFEVLRRRQFLGSFNDYRMTHYIDPLAYMERYYTIRYYWFVPRAESSPHLTSLTRVFTSDTWMCVLLAMFLFSLSLKFLDIFRSTDYSQCFLSTYFYFSKYFR
ncbi:hypothetical protein L9F63_027010 [Diploptera punctata]|uniref:Uncharacterized protein n=1 Tax=Diploptera punctata TaxID=6984 RepID=A0AAD8ADH5_DIPPU|nr:hypothetical protein L9F63_027010 [Diploptera punctata]